MRVALIKTCADNADRLAACLATWAAGLRYAGVFVYSTPPMLGSGDRRENIAAKLRAGLGKLLRENGKFTHCFICDDDTFVHPARWLAHAPAGDMECATTPEIPWAHGGAGWWMNRELCEIFCRNALRQTKYDDVLATDLAKRFGKRIVSRPDLYSQFEGRVSDRNNLITCHYVLPHEMHDLFWATADV